MFFPSCLLGIILPVWRKGGQEWVPGVFGGYRGLGNNFTFSRASMWALLKAFIELYHSGRFLIFSSSGSGPTRWVWPVHPQTGTYSQQPLALETSPCSIIQSKVLSLEKGKEGYALRNPDLILKPGKSLSVFSYPTSNISKLETKIQHTHFLGVTPSWGHSPATPGDGICDSGWISQLFL